MPILHDSLLAHNEDEELTAAEKQAALVEFALCKQNPERVDLKPSRANRAVAAAASTSRDTLGFRSLIGGSLWAEEDDAEAL